MLVCFITECVSKATAVEPRTLPILLTSPDESLSCDVTLRVINKVADTRVRIS